MEEGGIPQWRGNPPSNSIIFSLFLQGSPWVSWSERRDGRNGATGEIGGDGDRIGWEGPSPREVLFEDSDKGAEDTFVIIALPRE